MDKKHIISLAGDLASGKGAVSRELAERRVFPAIDVKRSGTRKEEMLLSKEIIDVIWKVRHSIKGDGLETSEQLVKQLKETKSNDDFIRRLNLLG